MIKSAIADPREPLADGQSLKKYPIGQDGASGVLFVPARPSKEPKWARFFNNYLSPEIFGRISSAGALFVVKRKERVFALAFGTGRFVLKPDCWEERFGLRVALNCIGESTVKSIDKDTLDPIARHSREQASRAAPASEFGLDIEQDLLRAVTGKPSEDGFGTWLTGMDTLHIAVPVTIETLPDLLDRIYEKYLDTSYQKTFPWVDQIAEVKDQLLKETLNGLLVERLRRRQKENTWMAVPEVLSWETIGGFRFPGQAGRIEYHDIHLDHFLESLPDLTAIDEHLLKSRTVECLDQDGSLLKPWRVYKCLYCELDHQGDAYLLSGGSWYRVQRGFVDQVNSAVDRIADYDSVLPEYDDDSEGDYIKRIARAASGELAVMDNNPVVYGGGASKIEFCDLLTKRGDLLHVKRYGQSAALSHLFAQGLTSGELFQIDPEFRSALNLKLPVGHRLLDPAKRPQQGEYRVVFAIVSDRPGPLALPFFSRINMKHAASRLEGYGFRVAKAKISVNDLRAKRKRIRNRKRSS